MKDTKVGRTSNKKSNEKGEWKTFSAMKLKENERM